MYPQHWQRDFYADRVFLWVYSGDDDSKRFLCELTGEEIVQLTSDEVSAHVDAQEQTAIAWLADEDAC